MVDLSLAISLIAAALYCDNMSNISKLPNTSYQPVDS